MATIKDLKTWQYYCDTLRLILRDWREKANIPAEFRSLYERKLTIKDLSHELARTIFYNYAKDITGAYSIDKDNRKTIDLIIQYLQEDEEFLKADPSYSFKKGLLLHGPVGTGKTALFKALRGMILSLRFYNPDTEFHESIIPGQFTVISANEIVRRFSVDGNAIFLRHSDGRKTDYVELIKEPICIDDFGSEQEASYYGQKTNIIAEILQERYEKKTLTHISTNLNMSAIKEAYGLRVADRMKEMFNNIPLTGASRRK